MRPWIALLLAGPVFALGPALPDFLPADTKVVVGIHLRSILDSPFGKNLSDEAAKLPATQMGGVDFLKDVDQLLIATKGSGQDTPALLVLSGRFSGPSVQEDPKFAGMLFAILDSSTAIAGDATLVRAAIARRTKGAVTTPAGLEARIQPLSIRYDIWGVGQSETADAFSFGAALRDGLDAIAEIHMRSSAELDKMKTAFKALDGILKAQAGGTKFDLQVKDGTLRLSIHIPEEELKKGIEAQKSALTAGLFQQMQPKLLPPPKPKPEGKILTDTKGDTVRVTLPGGR